MQRYHDYHVTGDRETARMLLHQVFAWMAVAIGLSAVAAWFAAHNLLLMSPALLLVLFMVQLGIIFLLSRNLMGLSYGSVKALFIAYSLINGLILSLVFLAYDISSIAQAFGASAGMFATMALYGWYTKTDLSSLGSFLMMALIGVVIASLINLWMMNSMLDLVISIVGVILFSILTAYDIQDVKRLGLILVERDEAWQKITIMCALKLYLDFVNLFLFMLRLFGRRRE